MYEHARAVTAAADLASCVVDRRRDAPGAVDGGGEPAGRPALQLLAEPAAEPAERAHASPRGAVSLLDGELARCVAVACDGAILGRRAAAIRSRLAARAETEGAATYLELGTRRVLIAEPAMTRVFALLEKLAGSRLPVLIVGETGVGKENAAYAVHHGSQRTGDFLAVNCAAIGPDGLFESTLFGHDKGVFTGAVAARPGLFESAAGGTVFLDEVGELPLAGQAKLLRALETQRIVRLGETKEREIDVRIVAATNRSLDDEVTAGRFRQDLYFRLSGATVVVPPLRDRRRETAMLARSLLDEACARARRARMTLAPEAMQALLTYAWPGNVRELKHAMEYVAAAAPGDRIEPHDLPARIVAAPPAPAAPPAAADTATAFRPIAQELRELERQRMAQALVAASGVRTRAARLIDMPIRTFTLKLKQYEL